jgi:hypothetical protein
LREELEDEEKKNKSHFREKDKNYTPHKIEKEEESKKKTRYQKQNQNQKPPTPKMQDRNLKKKSPKNLNKEIIQKKTNKSAWANSIGEDQAIYKSIKNNYKRNDLSSLSISRINNSKNSIKSSTSIDSEEIYAKYQPIKNQKKKNPNLPFNPPLLAT